MDAPCERIANGLEPAMRVVLSSRKADCTQMVIPTEIDLAKALQVSIAAAEAAGELIRRGLGCPKSVRAKETSNDFVTDVDRAAEAIILDQLLDAYPLFSVLSEEAGETLRVADWAWIVDPIDGTTNLIRGIPHVSVSIALAHRRQPMVACIHDPLRRETYTAISGQGARRNGVAIQVSPTDSLGRAILVVGFSKVRRRAALMIEGTRSLLDASGGLRTTGSACLDLAYVACGRVDGMWYAGLSMWDVAAGMLLVAEAGGHVSAPSGAPLVDPEAGIIASNGALHMQILHAIRGRQ
ncbi:inositol monophosphatase [Candidatus Bipolaricaulota bacterium]|nr:inositol monophosphatase [Candidatus Bipolaricaulota bacterium]